MHALMTRWPPSGLGEPLTKVGHLPIAVFGLSEESPALSRDLTARSTARKYDNPLLERLSDQENTGSQLSFRKKVQY